MSRKADHAGKKSGRLTVVKFMHKIKGHAYWECECTCGNKKILSISNVLYGNTNSCGCLNREVVISRNKVGDFQKRPRSHGMSYTKMYNIWAGIKRRCTNKKVKEYKNYGGRGIKICDRWSRSFENFYNDIGELPTESHTIERIDNDGNYEPSNCRWATRLEQGENQRRSIKITYKGDTGGLRYWSEKTGIQKRTLLHRYHKGWPVEKILTQEVIPQNRKKIIHNGVAGSIRHWSKMTGIDRRIISKCLKNGLTIDAILSGCKNSPGKVSKFNEVVHDKKRVKRI